MAGIHERAWQHEICAFGTKADIPQRGLLGMGPRMLFTTVVLQ